MRLLHKTSLGILFILNVYLYGQSFEDFHEIDKKIHYTYIDINPDCSPGADVSMFDSIIEESHNSYYLFAAKGFIEEKIMLAMVTQQEEIIYEMAEKYNDLANQALTYGISNKYIHHKFISLFINHFIDGDQSVEDDLLSLADNPDINNNPYKQFEIETFLWEQTITEEHEIHHEKIIALKKLLDSETDPDVAVMKFRKFYMKPLQSENNYEK